MGICDIFSLRGLPAALRAGAVSKRVYEKFQKSGKFSAEIASPDQKDASGETLLNLAIDADDAAAIPLDHDAEVNLAGRDSFMQVQRARFCKNENIFRILLSNGADVDAENDAKLNAQILRGRIYGRKKLEQAKQDH